MRVIVLLPSGVEWPAIDEVRIEEDGAVDQIIGSARRYGRQLDLDVAAVDDELDELLQSLGSMAVELGGVALDGRTLEPIVEQPEEAVSDVSDPGPIWEHLPGNWAPGPATGKVIDALPAIEQIERGIADVADDEVDARPPTGFTAIPGAARLVRTRLVQIIMVSLVMIGAFELVGSAWWWDAALTATTLLLLAILLLPAPASPRRAVPWTIAAAAIVATLGSAPVPFVALLTLPTLAIPAGIWAGGDPRESLRAMARLLRLRWPSIYLATFAWSVLVFVPFGVLFAAFGQQADPALPVLLTLFYLYPTALGALATEANSPT